MLKLQIKILILQQKVRTAAHVCASDPLIHIYLAAVKCTVILQSIIQLIRSWITYNITVESYNSMYKHVTAAELTIKSYFNLQTDPMCMHVRSYKPLHNTYTGLGL